MGWAEITHPFHPRRGQRFQILKARQVSGIQTLVLRGTSGGTFAVHQEWTDQAPPSSSSSLKIVDGILNAHALLALVELVANLGPKKERVDK